MNMVPQRTYLKGSLQYDKGSICRTLNMELVKTFLKGFFVEMYRLDVELFELGAIDNLHKMFFKAL